MGAFQGMKSQVRGQQTGMRPTRGVTKTLRCGAPNHKPSYRARLRRFKEEKKAS